MQRFWKYVINFVLVLMVLVGLVLVFNKQIAGFIVDHQKTEVVASKPKPKKKSDYDYDKVKALDSATIAKARLKKQYYVGVVAMPEINMSVPISEGISNYKLALGAGTLKPDQKMGQGNYALAGHNMHSGSTILFGPLYTKAKTGQSIYLSDMQNVYQYKVDTVKQIAATDTKVVNDQPGQQRVTLVTCNDSGVARIEVVGHLVKQQKFENTKASVRDSLTKNVHEPHK